MTAEHVTAVLVLTGLQLLLLRVVQVAVPSLYFTTSSLFDRRKHVSVGAVLFRLAIPFVAGICAGQLVDENEIAVAAVAGAAAWFLVIWPIIWSPVLVPHPLHFPFVAVLMAFWVAFVLLPPAGVVVSDFMETSISGRAPEWQAQYVGPF